MKDCKLISSLLETQNDIKRRKGLQSIQQIETPVFKQRYYHQCESKAKSYIWAIFLYNSKLWALTNKMQNKVDSFTGKLLGLDLNVWSSLWSTMKSMSETLNCGQ